VVLFLLGWMLQFIGHAIEGKPPEFFEGLALSAGGIAVVVGEDARKSLAVGQEGAVLSSHHAIERIARQVQG